MTGCDYCDGTVIDRVCDRCGYDYTGVSADLPSHAYPLQIIHVDDDGVVTDVSTEPVEIAGATLSWVTTTGMEYSATLAEILTDDYLRVEDSRTWAEGV